MSRAPLLILMGLLAAFGLLAGCDGDDDDNGGNPPATGTLEGRIIFHGEWPDSGTVQLSLFENWSTSPCSWCGVAPGGPPSYYTDAEFFQDPTPGDPGPDTLTYRIEGITFGTYRAAAVGWRAPTVQDINCDEPVIGLFGADPNSADSIPETITFAADDATQMRDIHAYFTLLPIPGCNDRGRIEGVVRLDGPWPQEGLLAMLTTFPVTAWLPLMGAPSGYYRMPTAADSAFRFTPPFGTYYVSVWTNAQPPAPVQWYGSYGIDAEIRQDHPVATDARPDALTISEAAPAIGGLVVPADAPPPHWISGDVNFTGQRPAEGLLVLISAFPFSPEHPPQGPPTGYFMITDPNETLYAVTGLPEGTYYASLWSNTLPPGQPTFYGAYGYTAGNDTDPDPVALGSTPQTWGANGIDISGQP